MARKPAAEVSAVIGRRFHAGGFFILRAVVSIPASTEDEAVFLNRVLLVQH